MLFVDGEKASDLTLIIVVAVVVVIVVVAAIVVVVIVVVFIRRRHGRLAIRLEYLNYIIIFIISS